MGTITLSASTTPAVRALAQVLWNAMDATTIRTGSPGGSWPFEPDSLDFSGLGKCTIAIDGDAGSVTFSFAQPQSPTFRGTLDLTLLEEQLTTAPNYLDYDSPSDLGPSSALSLTSPGFTKEKSGIVYLTAEFNGTQSAQAIVSAALYRDYGTPGQVALNSWSFPPGGLAPYAWSGHIHDTDALPDASAHTYTVIATGSGGSMLSASAGQISLIVFELGGPG